MIKTNSDINFYVDSLIVEALLTDDVLVKNAQGSIIHEFADKIKNYFGNHIKPEDKAGSILDMLIPGSVGIIFRSLGMPWIGMLLGLAINVFHIDVRGALSSIYNNIKSFIHSGPTTSANINAVVDNAIKSNTAPLTGEDERDIPAKILQMQSKSFNIQLREANLLKLSLKEYNLTKQAGLLNVTQGKVGNILSRVLGWFFSIALASAGLLIVGDVVNKFLGAPNAIDNTLKDGKPVEAVEQAPPPVSMPKSTQTKFPLNASYSDEHRNLGTDSWMINKSASESSIQSMVIEFAKEVYKGLDGLESIIIQTPAYQVVVENIVYANRDNMGTNMIIIPRIFHSKKQIVDLFIDYVAKRVA